MLEIVGCGCWLVGLGGRNNNQQSSRTKVRGWNGIIPHIVVVYSSRDQTFLTKLYIFDHIIQNIVVIMMMEVAAHKNESSTRKLISPQVKLHLFIFVFIWCGVKLNTEIVNRHVSSDDEKGMVFFFSSISNSVHKQSICTYFLPCGL